jgi:hypothetical protein
MLRLYKSLRVRNPGILLSLGLLEPDVPTLALQSMINGDFAGNYHLMKEESPGGTVIPPRITRSWARNPPEDGDSAKKLPTHLL